jgi:hypothetical protein
MWLTEFSVNNMFLPCVTLGLSNSVQQSQHLRLKTFLNLPVVMYFSQQFLNDWKEFFKNTALSKPFFTFLSLYSLS